MTIYTSPHKAVQEVLSLARAMLRASPDSPQMPALREQMCAALKVLDGPDSMASMSDIHEAREMYENTSDVYVDPAGHALVSRGEDGVWVSAWVLVRDTPT